MVAVCCFVSAIFILPWEYNVLTEDLRYPEVRDIKESFDFTIFMLYILTVIFLIAGGIDFLRSKPRSG